MPELLILLVLTVLVFLCFSPFVIALGATRQNRLRVWEMRSQASRNDEDAGGPVPGSIPRASTVPRANVSEGFWTMLEHFVSGNEAEKARTRRHADQVMVSREPPRMNSRKD